MQATNIAVMSNTSQVLAQQMRQAGLNVQVEAMDWSNVVQRRSNKAAPNQGGWNIFITWSGGNAMGNPILLAAHAATGDKAWFGWPSDAKQEELRTKWALAPTLEERKAVARELQANAWNFVPQLYYGQWVQPVAMRKNLRGLLPVPEIVPWWNAEKV
jgi:peptide/nickel transport system substrate-binding protein